MNRTISLIWTPIIAAIAILASIYFGSSFYSGYLPIALIGYSIIAVIYGKLLSNQPAFNTQAKQKDSITTVSSIYALACCLLVTTITAFIATISGNAEQWWVLIFLIIPLVVSTFIGGLSEISSEQLTKGFEHRSEERRQSLDARTEWESTLKEIASTTESSLISNEIRRIMRVIRFSSYFRTTECWSNLEELKTSTNEEKVLQILKEVK